MRDEPPDLAVQDLIRLELAPLLRDRNAFAMKVGDIKEMILAQVGQWVEEKIFQAGIKWLLSLLNPVAAFIKACMAIYDIVKFFIERATQIAALINAIVDTLGSIVSGNISTMAKKIEDALVKLIPVAIGFLASLLNLGGISEAIRAVIDKLRAPVNAAIDWITNRPADRPWMATVSFASAHTPAMQPPAYPPAMQPPASMTSMSTRAASSTSSTRFRSAASPSPTHS